VLGKFVFVGYEKDYYAQGRCCCCKPLSRLEFLSLRTNLSRISSGVGLTLCDLALSVLSVENSRCKLIPCSFVKWERSAFADRWLRR
jgi:hypothetical protein